MSKPWRNAATLLVACRDKMQVTQYRLLMVKRSGASSFFANAHVFPGGVLDPADYSDHWWDVYTRDTESLADILKRPENEAWRPPLYDVHTGSIPAELAYRLCALRETFEEAGVLLTRPTESPRCHSIKEELEEWRGRVQNDAGQFYSMCKELELVPDVWSLLEWSNWLTPTSETMKHAKPRRFDTIFYIACLEDEVMESSHDRREVTSTEWVDVHEVDRAHRAAHLILGPPQLYEVRRLQQLPTWSRLHEFATQRRHCGCQRLLPVRVNCADGVVSLLPGDGDYPEGVDIMGGSDQAPLTQVTMCESRSRVAGGRVHRVEIYGLHDMRVRCNVAPPCGHIAPLTAPAMAADTHHCDSRL